MSSALTWLRGTVARRLAVVLLVGLGGCSAPVDEAGSVSQRMPRSEPVHGGHLRVGYALEPTSLDAVLGRSGGDAYYWRQIYDQLVDADRDLNPRASTSLATSWEISEDPDAITFRLREGVVFHDGTPFDAEAVKFNVDRILDPATKATPRASMTVIDSVDVVDDYVVRFNLSRPWGAGLNMLADRGGVMNSPAEVLRLGADYGWQPAGTGPFRVDKVITGTMVRLVRNEAYWGVDADGRRLPYLDEVTIRVIRDETVLASALRPARSTWPTCRSRTSPRSSATSRFRIETMDGGSVAMLLAFNVGSPPLDDVNLRLAVAHAIDPVVINKAIYFDKVLVADSGMWPVGAMAHDPDVPRPYYDLDKAREYLAKGGKPDGFEFTAMTWTSPVLIPTAEIIRAMLKKIGVVMNIEVFSVGVATENFFHGRQHPGLHHRLEPLPGAGLDRLAGVQERRLLQRRQPDASGRRCPRRAGRFALWV